MAKQSQVKSKRKLLNPIFHLQTDEEDDNQLSNGMIKIVRRTGQLNLSGCSLATVPNRMFTMYETEVENEVDLSKPSEEPWWSFSPLIYLDLSSNVLQKLPSAIKMFEDLTVLNLQDNCLKELPVEIGNLIKLTKLNLCRNKLTALPKELYKLIELKQLFIAHNNLEVLTDDLGDLIMLEQLDLSYNNLTNLPPGLGFLARLVEINVSYNKLVDLPPEITGLRVLTKLDVTNNNLKLLPNFCDMRRLQLLHAQHNDIEELPDFTGCEGLQQLHLGNNFVKIIDVDFCENMTHLKILDFRDNKIDNLPHEIAMCQNLIRLDLTNNALETLPNSLSLLPHLQNLQVEGNKLKQIRSDVIKGGTARILKHLREKFDEESNSPDYQLKENYPSLNIYTFPDRYVMSHCRSLSLGMQDLNAIPQKVFEDAKTAEVTVVDLCKNKFATVPEGLQLIASQLTELNLSSNLLKAIPEFIADCSKLQYLDVSKNMLSELPCDLGCLKWMREVVIANNRFGRIPECVYEMEGLEILNASDNQILEVNVDGLSKLKKLAVLQLANNSINFVPPELGNLKQLRSLELTGNSFRQPRYSVLEQGTESILAYLRDRIPQ
uniref:Disease resistance R13L4/SHOC-2-like LRR domain-containing protein n=3 Tax=Photinus pyralis TaxID=7054 RepID=A0A1Y1KX67_PHOPY